MDSNIALLAGISAVRVLGDAIVQCLSRSNYVAVRERWV
jgi:hypothetical protein